MSTPNFKFMKFDMPLIVSPDYSRLEKRYEEDGLNEELGEYDEYRYEDDMYFVWEDMEEAAKEINKELVFYEVEVCSGYYDGIQFVVNQQYEMDFDLEKGSEYEIDNDDAHCYFNMCRSAALNGAERERKKIRKWLLSMKEYGYLHLNCDGVFSNGEAIYSLVE